MNTRAPSTGYLVVGLIFIGLAGSWLLDETGVMDEDGFQWFLPAVLLGAGLIGLLSSLGKGVFGGRATEPETAPTFSDPAPPVLDVTSDLDRRLAEPEAGPVSSTVIHPDPDTEGTER